MSLDALKRSLAQKMSYQMGEYKHIEGKDKTYLWQRDGLYYILENNVGTFIIKVYNGNFSGLGKSVKESFTFKLPKIPITVINDLIGFYRHIYNKQQTEVYVDIFYDTENKEYIYYVPKQDLSAALAHMDSEGIKESLDMGKQYIHVMETHSHHNMRGKFSSIDDATQTLLGTLHFVIGNIFDDNYTFELRMTFGDYKINIPIEEVFDGFVIEENDFSKFGNWEEKISLRRSNITTALSEYNSIVNVTEEDIKELQELDDFDWEYNVKNKHKNNKFNSWYKA